MTEKKRVLDHKQEERQREEEAGSQLRWDPDAGPGPQEYDLRGRKALNQLATQEPH